VSEDLQLFDPFFAQQAMMDINGIPSSYTLNNKPQISKETSTSKLCPSDAHYRKEVLGIEKHV
jgi:hypothetical protein